MQSEFGKRILKRFSRFQMKFVKPLNLYQDLLKPRAVDRGRFLGLDVGDRYVGLAVSDFDNKVASPLTFKLISKLSLSAFIVGYPYENIQKNNKNASVYIIL
ncbi:putative pre-16S rRNA nuclease, ribonuclease H-like superfamily [Helianthus anomalus]